MDGNNGGETSTPKNTGDFDYQGPVLDKEQVRQDAKEEFGHLARTDEATRITKSILSGRFSVDDYLGAAPSIESLFDSTFKRDYAEAESRIEQATKALEEGEKIIRKKGLGNLGYLLRKGWKNLTEEERVITPSLYSSLQQARSEIDQYLELAVSSISAGQKNLAKKKEYMGKLDVSARKWGPVASDLEDYINRLRTEIADLRFDVQNLEMGPEKRKSLEQTLGTLIDKEERLSDDEALAYEQVEILTNRHKMAKQEYVQDKTVLSMMRRYAKIARHHAEEIDHLETCREDGMDEYAKNVENMRKAIQKSSVYIAKVLGEKQAKVKAVSEMLRTEGLPVQIYSEGQLAEAEGTTKYARETLAEQNKKSISRGLSQRLD